jgi:hypothetical protein
MPYIAAYGVAGDAITVSRGGRGRANKVPCVQVVSNNALGRLRTLELVQGRPQSE